MMQDKITLYNTSVKKTQRMEWLQEKKEYEVDKLVKKGRKYQKRPRSEPSFFPPLGTVSYISNVKCTYFVKVAASLTLLFCKTKTLSWEHAHPHPAYD